MVEWKEIKSVCKTATPPIKLSTSDYRDKGKFPIIDQGKNDIVGYTDEEKAILGNNEYVLFGDHTCIVKYYKGQFAQGADGLKILLTTKDIITKYFYYAFSNIVIPQRGYSRHWSIAKDIKIPIPSLAEQTRIVEILDTFTASIANIKEQIKERRKQYEYYRDQLLDIEKEEGEHIKILEEICEIRKERISSKELSEDNYVSVENLLKDKAGRVDSENVPQEGNWSKYYIGDILIGNIRPYLKKIWLADRNGGTNGDVIVISPKEGVLPKYLYNILSSEKFFVYYNQTAKGGKMPRGDKKQILVYPTRLHSISEQNRIVTILDQFEASIANLEAQLKEREKQYEYYRNQLLTFE